MTKGKEIIKRAMEILNESPEGIQYSELVKRIETDTHQNINTIQGCVWNLNAQFPDQILKPARGFFIHVKYKSPPIPARTPLSGSGTSPKEEEFYEPFADWLVNEIEECTKAIPLGRNYFKEKWGTPDVIGKQESRSSDIIRIPTDIITAEIKIDTNQLITAFGQACAYRLFSHKSYLAIPKNSSAEDISRLDSLSLISGIGLVLFDNANPKDPKFEVRTRPIKHEPDMFYVNKYMKVIEEQLFR